MAGLNVIQPRLSPSSMQTDIDTSENVVSIPAISNYPRDREDSLLAL
jgi:hypothetical protein